MSGTWWWAELFAVLLFYGITAKIAWKISYSDSRLIGGHASVLRRVKDFFYFLMSWVLFSFFGSLPFVWAENFWDWLNTADRQQLRLGLFAVYAIALVPLSVVLGQRQRTAPVLWAWLMAASIGGVLIVHLLPTTHTPL